MGVTVSKTEKKKELHVHLSYWKYGIRKHELLTLALQDSLGLLWKHE